MFFDILKSKKTSAPAAISNSEAVGATTTQTSNLEARSFEHGLVSVQDIIAPSALEVDFNQVRINNRYFRTLYVVAYPRFVTTNWLSSLINFDHPLSVSMYIYPAEGKQILDDLRRKIAEMEAEISTDMQRGKVVNPSTQAKLEDALVLQEDLVKGEERFFQFGLYITISSEDQKELEQVSKQLEASLGALLIISKKATLQMEEAFKTGLPLCKDYLNITRNMDTTSLATTFPFVSSDLSDDQGIMYGINQHNGSLVIFDRFGMENYNSVIFAKAGAGKSYMVKLEALRSMMMNTEVIVIDPENEYQTLCESVGGQYVAFGLDEDSKINPFDLSLVAGDEENELQRKIMSLHGLFKVIMGELDPEEEAILDRSLMATYKMKGITPDVETQTKEAPLIEDLYKALIGMEDKRAQSMAARIEKFIKGSFAGIVNSHSTVNLKNQMVVFGIKNLEEALRPVAMYIILDYIWSRVRKDVKKRVLIVDEAWYMMQHPESSLFLYSIAKRARKYFLGVTTITQDVEDFLNIDRGKAIINNSSIQILLKQHSAAIDKLAEVFYLSEGEKQLLLSASVGEGIFFAGQNHVAIRIIASPEEHELITTNPQELENRKKAKPDIENQIYKPKTPEIVQKAEEVDLEPAQVASDVKSQETQVDMVLPAKEEVKTEMPKAKTDEPDLIQTLDEPKVEPIPSTLSTEDILARKVAELEIQKNKEAEEQKMVLDLEEKTRKEEEAKKKAEEEEKRKQLYGNSNWGGAGAWGGGSWKPPSAPVAPPAPASNPRTPVVQDKKVKTVDVPGNGWEPVTKNTQAKTKTESTKTKVPKTTSNQPAAVDYKKLADEIWGKMAE